MTTTAATPGTAAGQDPPVPAGLRQPAPPQACKRPGCARLIPPAAGRGRSRVFCSDDCARRYHNDARQSAPARQAEADARAETSRQREDAARERDALAASHAAQIQAQRDLTDAERA
ncbi:MAG TPA: hypothetical protein VMK13_14545, partial [Streptosporangiaceae bacterium]|nr:hypothetical protein [Streptosporangiaceae bacterium]